MRNSCRPMVGSGKLAAQRSLPSEVMRVSSQSAVPARAPAQGDGDLVVAVEDDVRLRPRPFRPAVRFTGKAPPSTAGVMASMASRREGSTCCLGAPGIEGVGGGRRCVGGCGEGAGFARGTSVSRSPALEGYANLEGFAGLKQDHGAEAAAERGKQGSGGDGAAGGRVGVDDDEGGAGGGAEVGHVGAQQAENRRAGPGRDGREAGAGEFGSGGAEAVERSGGVAGVAGGVHPSRHPWRQRSPGRRGGARSSQHRDACRLAPRRSQSGRRHAPNGCFLPTASGLQNPTHGREPKRPSKAPLGRAASASGLMPGVQARSRPVPAPRRRAVRRGLRRAGGDGVQANDAKAGNAFAAPGGEMLLPEGAQGCRVAGGGEARGGGLGVDAEPGVKQGRGVGVLEDAAGGLDQRRAAGDAVDDDVHQNGEGGSRRLRRRATSRRRALLQGATDRRRASDYDGRRAARGAGS